MSKIFNVQVSGDRNCEIPSGFVPDVFYSRSIIRRLSFISETEEVRVRFFFEVRFSFDFSGGSLS